MVECNLLEKTSIFYAAYFVHLYFISNAKSFLESVTFLAAWAARKKAGHLRSNLGFCS